MQLSLEHLQLRINIFSCCEAKTEESEKLAVASEPRAPGFKISEATNCDREKFMVDT